MSYVMGRACQTGACADPCACAKHYDETGMTGGFCTLTLGPQIATGPCSCPMSYSLGSTFTFCDHGFNIDTRYIDFPAIAANRNIHVVRDFGALCGNTLLIVACNGATSTTLYADLTCQLGSASFNLSVPAGTNRLYISVAGGCNAPQDTTDVCVITITCSP